MSDAHVDNHESLDPIQPDEHQISDTVKPSLRFYDWQLIKGHVIFNWDSFANYIHSTWIIRPRNYQQFVLELHISGLFVWVRFPQLNVNYRSQTLVLFYYFNVGPVVELQLWVVAWRDVSGRHLLGRITLFFSGDLEYEWIAILAGIINQAIFT